MANIKSGTLGRTASTQRNTLKDRTYSTLRHALITGQFQPGEQVTVKFLVEKLQSGTMPVREAVQRLVAEGALISLPNGRVCVPDLSRKDFHDIVEARLLLEPHCCGEATRNTPEKLARDLVTLQKKLVAASKGGKPGTTLWANHQFHFRIYQHANSPLLLGLIESVWLRFGPAITHTLTETPDSASYIASELKLHDELCKAIAAGKSKDAESIMRRIIEGTANWYEKSFPFDE